MKILAPLFALSLLAFPSPEAQALSCPKAKTPTERTLCASPTLKALDAAMTLLFQKNKGYGKAAVQLTKEQREWAARREKRCGRDRSCLRTEVLERTESLCRIVNGERKAQPEPTCLFYDGAFTFHRELKKAKEKLREEDLKDLSAAALRFPGEPPLLIETLQQARQLGGNQRCAEEAARLDPVAFAKDNSYFGHHIDAYLAARKSCGLETPTFESEAPARVKKQEEGLARLEKEISARLRPEGAREDFSLFLKERRAHIQARPTLLSRLGLLTETVGELRGYQQKLSELKSLCPPEESSPSSFPLGCQVREGILSEHREALGKVRVLVWTELLPPFGDESRIVALHIFREGKLHQRLELPSRLNVSPDFSSDGELRRAIYRDCDGDGTKDLIFVLWANKGGVGAAECLHFDPATKKFAAPFEMSEEQLDRAFPAEED